jgi:hypothetical protein
MEEIKAILTQWEEAGIGSGTGIEMSYQIISILIDKVEELDAKVNG